MELTQSNTESEEKQPVPTQLHVYTPGHVTVIICRDEILLNSLAYITGIIRSATMSPPPQMVLLKVNAIWMKLSGQKLFIFLFLVVQFNTTLAERVLLIYDSHDPVLTNWDYTSSCYNAITTAAESGAAVVGLHDVCLISKTRDSSYFTSFHSPLKVLARTDWASRIQCYRL